MARSDFEKLIEKTILEYSPILAKSRKSIVKKASTMTKDGDKHQTRDWLVNKKTNTAQKGSSNKVTSGNKTTNDTTNYNKEREEQEMSTTQQGLKQSKDDDSHNEFVTQTRTSKQQNNTVSKKARKKFKAHVTSSINKNDYKLQQGKKKADMSARNSDGSRKSNAERARINSIKRKGTVKNAAQGVLGSIITNM